MFGYQKQIRKRVVHWKESRPMFWHRLLIFSWSRSQTGAQLSAGSQHCLIDGTEERKCQVQRWKRWLSDPSTQPLCHHPESWTYFALKKKRTKIPEKATETGTNYRLSSKKAFCTGRWALVYLETAGERKGGPKAWADVTIPVDHVLFFFLSVQTCFQLATVSQALLCPFSIVLLSFFTHQLKLLLFWARSCPLANTWVITQCACN